MSTDPDNAPYWDSVQDEEATQRQQLDKLIGGKDGKANSSRDK